MDTYRTIQRVFLGRDVAIAFAVVVALYLVRYVGVQALQIPAYLMIVAYDLVEVALPFLTPYHPVVFPIFLYVLAIVGAAAARWHQANDGDDTPLGRTIGGVLLVVGSLSVLFGVLIGGPLVSPSDNPTPLAVTGATGLLFLFTGWWLQR